MKRPSSKAGRIATVAATPVAILAASALVWQSSYAAFSGTTRNSGNDWSTGSVNLTDDDAGAARFQVANMTPGDTETKCITVTATTSGTGTVKGYAVNPVASPQGLEDHILVTVDAGTGGGFASCTGFTSEGTVIPSMSLAALAAFDSYANGAGGWDVTAGTHSRTYQITWTFDTTGMTQNQIDQLQGAHTGIDFQWELQST
jgi:hypothetical protein